MYSKAKKILITSEAYETVVIRRNDFVTRRSFCEQCHRNVDTFTIDAAARIAGIGSRRLVEMIVYEGLHSFETSNGSLYICGDSLGPIVGIQMGEL